MSEEFKVDNSYTISVVTTEEEYTKENSIGRTDPVHKGFSLKRTFNFKSTQVTTLYREWIKGDECNHSGYAALTSNMDIKNFKDIGSDEEIKMMYEKLVNMGGRPPELSGVLKTMGRSVPFKKNL